MPPKSPFITALISAYNRESLIQATIDSVLTQTYENFELLIVDDGSTDRTVEVIRANRDPRLRLIALEKNVGIPTALNVGLRAMDPKTDYIVKVDSDDISLPHRFRFQCDFMEANPHVSASCGSCRDLINASQVWSNSADNETIQARLLFRNCMGHPAGIMRAGLGVFYDESFRVGPDYQLWCDYASKGDLVNLADVLVLYRVHDGNVSKTNTSNQTDSIDRVRMNQLERLKLVPTADEFQIHRGIGRHSYLYLARNMEKTFHWIEKVRTANALVNVVTPRGLEKEFLSCFQKISDCIEPEHKIRWGEQLAYETKECERRLESFSETKTGMKRTVAAAGKPRRSVVRTTANVALFGPRLVYRCVRGIGSTIFRLVKWSVRRTAAFFLKDAFLQMKKLDKDSRLLESRVLDLMKKVDTLGKQNSRLAERLTSKIREHTSKVKENREIIEMIRRLHAFVEDLEDGNASPDDGAVLKYDPVSAPAFTRNKAA